MGKFCEVCEKRPVVGNNVSHSNRKSSRTWAPNVQKVRLTIDGRVVSVSMCTRCLRNYQHGKGPFKTTQTAAATEQAYYTPLPRASKRPLLGKGRFCDASGFTT